MTRSEVSISPELADCVQGLRALLDHRIRLVDAIIAVLVEHPSAKTLRPESSPVPAEVAQALPLMLQALGSSSSTVVRLSDAPGLVTRDCYSIARSIVELAVNICYLISDGPSLAGRAMRHAMQKAYQDLERESKIGDSTIRLAFSSRPDAATVPGLAEQIAEFTSRAGREKGWVDESVDDRIAAAGARFGEDVLTSLHFARFMVYRHSSEILHGTLFSALYFFGITTPPKKSTQETAVEHIGQQHMMLLMACGFALEAVVGAFHAAYGFQWAQDRSKELTKSMSALPYLNKPET
jgi:hypothetical protein